MARNKVVLNISKSTVFGTNHSLNPKSELNLIINNVEIVQVQVTKLLEVMLYCKLSWSKLIHTTVAKMGRSMSMIRQCSIFLTALSTMQDLQALDFSYLDYGSVVWSGGTKKDLGKLQLVQNRAARLAPRCTQRANINNMHVNLSWRKVEETLTSC